MSGNPLFENEEITSKLPRKQSKQSYKTFDFSPSVNLFLTFLKCYSTLTKEKYLVKKIKSNGVWTRASWKPSKRSASSYFEILIRLLQFIYVVSISVGRFLQISGTEDNCLELSFGITLQKCKKCSILVISAKWQFHEKSRIENTYETSIHSWSIV